MRIISKIHDYYDCIQATMRDETLTFVRKPWTIDSPECLSYPHRLYLHDAKDESEFTLSYVGFCGKLYPMVRIDLGSSDTLGYPDHEIAFLYDSESVNQVIDAIPMRRSTRRPPRWKRKYQITKLKLACKIWFDGFRYESPLPCQSDDQIKVAEAEKLFVKHKAVCIMPYDIERRNCDKIEFNGSLREFEFFKRIDAFTAFQEIQMFLGNDLADVRTSKVPVGDDKTLAASKGFNKFSFRKDPKKRRK